MNIDAYIAIGTFLMSGVALFFSLRKQKHDTTKTDVDTGSAAITTTGNALQIANDAAKQVSEVRTEMGKMRTKYNGELDGLRMEVEELRYELLCERSEKVAIKEWADELVKQIVVEFRGTPKKMKPFVIPEREVA